MPGLGGRSSTGAAALAGIAALGVAAGAVGARRRDLGPAFHDVASELRAPLLVFGHGPTGEPQPVTPESFTGMMRLTSQGRIFPRRLGRERVIDSGGRSLRLWLYETPARREAGPSGALIWIHGGGLIAGGPAQDHGLCSRIARELGVLVVSVDYRLAPEHPYPAAIDDVWSALRWLRMSAPALGVDTARVAVGGASAGGGLAAALAQRCRDEEVDLAFQMLIYPMLDDRTGAGGVDIPGRGDFVWTARQNAECWQAYLSHPSGEPEDRPWAAAARREDLTGLAPAWIGVGALDLFVDECVDYAGRLEASGVPVRLRVEPGMYHGADICQWARSMRDFRGESIDELGRALRTA